MGGEIAGHRGEVFLDADLHGTAPIERVEVVSGRKVVWQASPGRLDVELRGVPMAAQDPWSAWYYLRLRQADGHRAWFSPLWVDRDRG